MKTIIFIVIKPSTDEYTSYKIFYSDQYYSYN